MKLRCEDVLNWRGELTRSSFLLWAVLLFAVKYNLDRLLLWIGFGRGWSILQYFDSSVLGVSGLTPAQTPGEFIALLALSLPFLWMGSMLCFKRLRSAGLPQWLVVLFVVPVLKWFLFVVLAIAPERVRGGQDVASRGASATPRARWLPGSLLGSAALASGVTSVLGVPAIWFATEVLGNYGWSMFVGIPFSMGFLAAIIHGAQVRRSLGESIGAAMLAIGLAGSALFVLAIEGAICLAMAAPIMMGLAFVGAVAGHAVQAARWDYRSSRLMCAPLLAVPLMLGTEALRPGPTPQFAVTTAIEVQAPPEAVWRHVVTFPALPEPTEWIFKLGLAYPTEAKITGQGVGAVRHCNFSTGPFVEPITVWDEPHLLRFTVTENPAPMQEWSPYGDIHPPHLDGFLVSRQGQFALTALPGGRTRLEGTTWYHHNMWPAAYWRVWSDAIIHAIHRRVLNHVKTLAEAGA